MLDLLTEVFMTLSCATLSAEVFAADRWLQDDPAQRAVETFTDRLTRREIPDRVRR